MYFKHNLNSIDQSYFLLLVREAAWREDELVACVKRLKRLGERVRNDLGRTRITRDDKEILDYRNELRTKNNAE